MFLWAWVGAVVLLKGGRSPVSRARSSIWCEVGTNRLPRTLAWLGLLGYGTHTLSNPASPRSG